MGVFEFVTILMTIIIGLGMATLLSGFVNALRPDTTSRPGFIHTVWVLWLFVTQVGIWSARWRLADRTEWSGWSLLAVLVSPVLLFIMASLLFPAKSEKRPLDDYLINIRRYFFGIVTIFWLTALWGSWYFDGIVPGFHTNTIFIVLSAAATGVLAWTANLWAHRILGMVFLILALFIWGSHLTVG